jgi:hypothetical protein
VCTLPLSILSRHSFEMERKRGENKKKSKGKGKGKGEDGTHFATTRIQLSIPVAGSQLAKQRQEDANAIVVSVFELFFMYARLLST